MHVSSVEEMNTEARACVASLTPSTHATVVTLSGDLGAGKTTFVQGALRALGVTEHITSPTFVIEKIYPLRTQKFSRAVHIDAYRLKDSSELKVLGWDELQREPGTIIFLEWPERVAELLTSVTLRVTLKYLDEMTREITYEKN